MQEWIEISNLASPGWGPVRVGAHMGPYGPLWAHIWAHMGLYGPIYEPIYGSIWALMGPPGQVLEKASTFRQLSVRLLDKFRTFRVPNLLFDEISR